MIYGADILRRKVAHVLLKNLRLPVLISVVILVSFCNSSSPDFSNESKMKNAKLSSDISNAFPYNLGDPDDVIKLPAYLNEISGLAFFDETRVLCIQDEKSNIYVLDVNSKEIESKFRFGSDGDYEDIAVAGKTVFVLRSDGHIFEVNNFDQENIGVTDHNTPLSGRNDTEGLAYDNNDNTLLVACKGAPDLDKKGNHKGLKAVYRFDLDKMKLKKDPAILIDLKSFDNFHPSGLAIDPFSDDIFLISGSGKVLVIINRAGKVLETHNLNPLIFRQPEGICFSPSGDLFIANEGSGSSGNILKFKRHK
jgi:uncharacterized protein YjiK